jgi:hypothetical protein
MTNAWSDRRCAHRRSAARTETGANRRGHRERIGRRRCGAVGAEQLLHDDRAEAQAAACRGLIDHRQHPHEAQAERIGRDEQGRRPCVRSGGRSETRPVHASGSPAVL